MAVAQAEGIAGLILSGGLSTRMGGGDKGLLPLAGRTILDHVLKRLVPQVAAIAISANGDPQRFAHFSNPVLADPLPGHPGPLAGILAGLDWAATLPGCVALLSTPGDTPFIPADLASSLVRATATAPGRIAVAQSGVRRHPVVALWPLAARDGLAEFLRSGEARVSAFMDDYGAVAVEFPSMVTASGAFDPFFNVNTPADLAEAERIAEALGP